MQQGETWAAPPIIMTHPCKQVYGFSGRERQTDRSKLCIYGQGGVLKGLPGLK